MEITRRNLIRAAAALSGAAAVGSTPAPGLAAEAVAGVRTRTTVDRTLHIGKPNAAGWSKVVEAHGEEHRVRDVIVPAQSGRARRRTPLLGFVQFSDVHIVDAQSPMRFEGQDRTPSGSGFSSSAYRPQEVLSGHTAEAMVRRINAISATPVLGQPLAFALQTGDNSDNGQFNEIRWNIDLLDGGHEIRVDSGDLTKYEGVMDQDPTFYDPLFYHPDGQPSGAKKDNYRAKKGFPKIPGLLDTARQPFQSTGLSIPWYVALGNHDELMQGNFVHSASFNAIATGSAKSTNKGVRTVTADPNRRLLDRAETVEEHFTTTGLPVGHGFTEQNRADGTAYYAFDAPGGLVRFLVMDSIRSTGSDQGEIDATQMAWLQSELDNAGDQLLVAACHHPSWTFHDAANGQAVVDMFLAQPKLIAWINGHTHKNNVRVHRGTGGGGFWEINTCAHIDWPIQSRIIEIADNHDGTLSIFGTLVDHSAALNPRRYDSTMQLAGLARAMAANDFDPETPQRRGKRKDRNVELLVPAPAFLTA
jgi:metallophosphoesterase (TIGR03767 family)